MAKDAPEPVVTREQLQHIIANDAAFTKQFGFVVTGFGYGWCRLSVPHLPHMERPDRITSGPLLITAADVAMWLAIKTARGIDDPSVTSHMQTDFLKSARGEGFTASAKVLKWGRRSIFGVVECVSEGGELLAFLTMGYTTPRR